MNKDQNSNPSSSNQNQMNPQGAPQSSLTESLQNQPFELETKPHATELLIQKAQNYERTSEIELVKDAWKRLIGNTFPVTSSLRWVSLQWQRWLVSQLSPKL